MVKRNHLSYTQNIQIKLLIFYSFDVEFFSVRKWFVEHERARGRLKVDSSLSKFNHSL